MGRLNLSASNGCWLDLFRQAKFRGEVCRLRGPAEFPRLRICEDAWNGRVMSLRVGPCAYVQFFAEANFQETVVWLLPNQRIENVTVLNWVETIDSARLFDRPPFAHEPGYAAYMLWAASQLARAGGSSSR